MSKTLKCPKCNHEVTAFTKSKAHELLVDHSLQEHPMPYGY